MLDVCATQVWLYSLCPLQQDHVPHKPRDLHSRRTQDTERQSHHCAFKPRPDLKIEEQGFVSISSRETVGGKAKGVRYLTIKGGQCEV